MYQVGCRGLKEVSEKSIQGKKYAHLAVGKVKMFSQSGKQRRNNPSKPVIDAVGDHEHKQNQPSVVPFRRHKHPFYCPSGKHGFRSISRKNSSDSR